ncbi:unnamed protein product [Rotaria sp. Silwood1]|nr:unnamed protein product [Rotaria sp. Silwood1]CAF1431083.1 unnamed protein product [Rotaria sp. Silwood1]CAF1488705.1 unnamed protein product [Rotaria sp. Silwood1]CAF3565528.1 unnamed protein product [Rotaria sp. Silwood1]CAF3567844.1 unnamed protein product [Rotaria sp. Silwood1]
MSYTKQWQSTGVTMTGTNFGQVLASEARLSRLHRLFKTHFNVTEPSLVLEPYLFLGNCISAHDTHRLSKLGIRYILNVAIRDVELCPYYSNDIRTLTIDLRDDDRENILRTFDQAFAFIDEARRNKSRVLVHCSHGQSRSPAIVIGYLMRTYNVPLEQCLNHVIKARPCVLPNDGFLKQLILYDRFLVDRRRQQEEAALMKAVNVVPPTEIPIQHKPSVTPQPVQPPLTVILPPTDYSTSEASNTTQLSSVDSSSFGLTSTSSIQSSTSAESIQIIPIQVQSKLSHMEKVKPVLIERASDKDESTVQEIKNDVKKFLEKVAVTDIAMTSGKTGREIIIFNQSTYKKRPNALITSIVKQNHSPSSRSHSAHAGRKHISHYKHPSTSPDAKQWEIVPYHSKNNYTFQEETPTKYITEIYDKATNRFIPIRC